VDLEVDSFDGRKGAEVLAQSHHVDNRLLTAQGDLRGCSPHPPELSVVHEVKASSFLTTDNYCTSLPSLEGMLRRPFSAEPILRGAAFESASTGLGEWRACRVYSTLTKDLSASTWGIEWARTRLTAGTPVILECYMHKLSQEERLEQIAFMIESTPEDADLHVQGR
jgi:hypothetical protein